ncbi:hypothetical protein F511_13000 [Dorcoceras hygrometricum]|uniref:Uncharacterized protein n=1 Tax=Dorcoceras hygrometricum TaxID=472368 RepID=A0A2Z7B8P9_9LAMI|nr:hypothetical protein F511_13000 [Dorcoceras hygrometricum]
MLLELAIAKRCRLHKLIRQRFALALKIQKEDFALIFNQSQRNQQAQRIEEGAKCSSRCAISAAKQLTIYERCLSTAELNSNGESDKNPAKEKDASTTLQRSVAPKWKEDKIAFWSAEEFWKLSNGKNFTEAIYSRQRPLKSGLSTVNETLCVRSVGATTYCGRVTLNIQCTNRGKNREIDEAINRH